MKRINVHELSLRVAKLEGGKKEMNIAQIKECIKCTLIELGDYDGVDILKLIERYRVKYNHNV